MYKRIWVNKVYEYRDAIYNRIEEKWVYLPRNWEVVTEHWGLYIVRGETEGEKGLGALNSSLEMVIPFRFDEVDIGNEFCTVKKSGKVGLLTRNKTMTMGPYSHLYEPLLRVQYDEISSILNYRFIVIKDGKQGVYDAKKESFLITPSIPIDYRIEKKTVSEEAIGYHNMHTGEYGYFDLTGKLLFKINIPSEETYPYRNNFFELGPFENGKAFVSGSSRRYKWVFNIDGSYEKVKIEYQNSDDNEQDYAADTWDALTDGMYGDYPGQTDYDLFGF